MAGWPPGLVVGDPALAGGILLALALLFAARVVGQLIVATRAPSWLPAMAEWQSGLLPYPILLALLVVFITVMGLVSLALLLGLPAVTARRPAAGEALLWLGWSYAIAMAVRYAVRMIRRPEARWTGGAIPIAFHLVLAAWLLVLGSYLRG